MEGIEDVKEKEDLTRLTRKKKKLGKYKIERLKRDHEGTVEGSRGWETRRQDIRDGGECRSKTHKSEEAKCCGRLNRMVKTDLGREVERW